MIILLIMIFNNNIYNNINSISSNNNNINNINNNIKTVKNNNNVKIYIINLYVIF